ncbi:glycogenin glucosyltransferase [Savitreella phatthalungensis]
MAREAYVTLLLNDAYLRGALVLAHSLRDAGATRELAIMVTSKVSSSARSQLTQIFDNVISVESLANPQIENLNLLGRLDLRESFTKINLWRQTQYSKVVFLDADVLVLQNIDHLFDIPADFAAAPDVGWPDIFNSGVFLARPDSGTYGALKRLADSGVSFDGGDQGLLNQFYSAGLWHRLSFTYNVTPSANYQYLPAFKHFESQIKVVHFIGAEKPWRRNTAEGVYGALLARWWSVHERHNVTLIKPLTSPRPLARSSSSQLSLNSILRSRGQSSPKDEKPFEAPQAAWDARTSSPPYDAKPEAAALKFVGNNNAWDDPSRDQLFLAPPTPRLPKSVHFEPPSPLPQHAVFPWENRPSVQPAQRVFPEDAIAPLQEIYEIERRASPSVTSVASSSGDERIEASPPSAHTPTFAQPLPVWTGGRGASSGASQPAFQFTNAWDENAKIREYVSNRRPLGSMSRSTSRDSLVGTATDEVNAGGKPRLPRATSTIELRQHLVSSSDSGSVGSQVGAGGASGVDDGTAAAAAAFGIQSASGVPQPEDWDPERSLDALTDKARELARRAAAQQTPPLAPSTQAVPSETLSRAVPHTSTGLVEDVSPRTRQNSTFSTDDQLHTTTSVPDTK